MDAPQNGRFYGKMKCLTLWPTYIGEKGRTLGKTYGIKVRCYWEHIGNLMGTWKEHVGTKEKWKNPLPDGPPFKKLYNNKIKALSACWAFPLTAWNFYFQNCLSSFLAWANTPIINWGYLFLPAQVVFLLLWQYWQDKKERCEKYKGIFLEKMNPRPHITWKNILHLPYLEDMSQKLALL